MASTPADQDLLDQLIADWKHERPDLDAAAMQIVGRTINLAGKLRSSANQALKPFELHYTDFDVLATLRRSGKPYRKTPTELSQLVLLTSGAMTAAIHRLEKRGLVSRAPDPSDGRAMAVVLTVEGVRLVDKAVASRFAEAETAVAALSPEDRARLAELLRTWTVLLA